jgi:class 3 adenylate cyclase
VTRDELNVHFEDNEINRKADTVAKFADILSESERTKAVLGIDVYRYSKMEHVPQALLPYVIDVAFHATVRNVLDHETAFFDAVRADEVTRSLIRTGDGFFAFFEDPIRALVFCIYLQANVATFNSHNMSPGLRAAIGEISVRYALTYGPVYDYEGTYYGDTIIRNSRLMSMDALNRFLMGQNCAEWFMKWTNGLDTLGTMLLPDLQPWPSFELDTTQSSLIFSHADAYLPRFRSLSSVKLGSISAKGTEFDVYSNFIQVLLRQLQPASVQKYVVTIGNQHTGDFR